MSDSDESGVTYTDMSSPFEELSDIGSPRANDHEHLIGLSSGPPLQITYLALRSQSRHHPRQIMSQVQSMLTMRLLLRIDHMLRMLHILPSHLTPVPMPAWSDSEIVRLLAISSPLASPLSLWSSPPPRIHFPSLPPILSPPSPVLSPAPPPSPIRSLGYRAAMIRLRDEVGESSFAAAARLAGGLRADYGFVATMDREIMCDPEREVGYGITDSWDEIVETLQGAPVSTDTELGGYTRVRQDTDEIYMRLDDEQTERQLLSGRLNMLFRDRHAHAYARHLMKTEARMSREAWVRATDASDLVHCNCDTPKFIHRSGIQHWGATS
nr:hypothetical protein [Tanacetum cinerariifolium]